MQLTLTTHLDPPMPANPHPTFRDEAPRSILVHQDFVEWFYSKDSDQQFVKRARFSLNKLLSHGYVTGSKPLVGPGKGWLRAGLGGGTGYSKYMWYATHTTAVGQELGLKFHEIAVRMGLKKAPAPAPKRLTGVSDKSLLSGFAGDVLAVPGAAANKLKRLYTEYTE